MTSSVLAESVHLMALDPRVILLPVLLLILFLCYRVFDPIEEDVA